MKSLLLLGCLTGLLLQATAINNFVGLLRQGEPCFKVTDTKSVCNSTLIGDPKELENPNNSGNEPRTWAFLFTPKNRYVAEPLHFCGGKLPPNTAFDPSAQTVVIIHGWLDGICRSAWMREMKEQFFERGKYNVILMDWTWGNSIDYFQASQNCKIVGEQCGVIITNIMNQTDIGPDKFHVIGHSFGGIATGFCGRKVQKANKGSLRRITPLDPALAAFANAPPEGRVTYRDAKLVDVIHSNGGNCSILTIGDSRPMGHADFYPNGGAVQPSCYYYIYEGLRKGDFLTCMPKPLGGKLNDEAVHLTQRGLYIEPLHYPFGRNKSPFNGHEYIHLVRQEHAESHPYGSTEDFLVAPLDEEDRPSGRPANLKEWNAHMAIAFSQVAIRLKSQRELLMAKFPPRNLPPVADEAGCCLFCLGSDMYKKIYEDYSVDGNVAGLLPYLSVVLHLSQEDILALLRNLSKWSHIIGMNHAICMWIYALLAVLCKPVSRECGRFLEEFYDECLLNIKESDEESQKYQLRRISSILCNYFCVHKLDV